MPQLKDDGLPGLSANDWLTPAINYLGLAVFSGGGVVKRRGRARWRRTGRAAARRPAVLRVVHAGDRLTPQGGQPVKAAVPFGVPSPDGPS
jgi:hypothetical protein